MSKHNSIKKAAFTSMTAVALLGAGTTTAIALEDINVVKADNTADYGKSVDYNEGLPFLVKFEGWDRTARLHGTPYTLVIGADPITLSVPQVKGWKPDVDTVTVRMPDKGTLLQEPMVVNYSKIPGETQEEPNVLPPSAAVYGGDDSTNNSQNNGAASNQTETDNTANDTTPNQPVSSNHTNSTNGSTPVSNPQPSAQTAHTTTQAAKSDDVQTNTNSNSGLVAAVVGGVVAAITGIGFTIRKFI